MNKISRFEKLGLLAVLVSLFACGAAKSATSVSVEWTPNMDPSVVGYNVYYGCSSRAYTNVFAVGTTNSAAVNGLVEGQTYFFAVTAFDASGDESDFSDETIYIVPGFLLLTPGLNPGDPSHIQFPVAPGHWYELQASSDLHSWTTIWQVVGVSNAWVEFDSPVPTSGSQFYRVVLH